MENEYKCIFFVEGEIRNIKVEEERKFRLAKDRLIGGGNRRLYTELFLYNKSSNNLLI